MFVQLVLRDLWIGRKNGLLVPTGGDIDRTDWCNNYDATTNKLSVSNWFEQRTNVFLSWDKNHWLLSVPFSVLCTFPDFPVAFLSLLPKSLEHVCFNWGGRHKLEQLPVSLVSGMQKTWASMIWVLVFLVAWHMFTSRFVVLMLNSCMDYPGDVQFRTCQAFLPATVIEISGIERNWWRPQLDTWGNWDTTHLVCNLVFKTSILLRWMELLGAMLNSIPHFGCWKYVKIIGILWTE